MSNLMISLKCKKGTKSPNHKRITSLRECYELGNGIEKNEFKAFDYFRKSAEKGYTGAKFYLGYCYINGIETEVNRYEGLKLLNEVAGKKFVMNKIFLII